MDGLVDWRAIATEHWRHRHNNLVARVDAWWRVIDYWQHIARVVSPHRGVGKWRIDAARKS